MTTGGGCLCRKVRYRIRGRINAQPGQCNFCHCTQCRQWTGSLVFAAKTVPLDQFAFLATDGSTSSYTSPPTAFKTYQSSSDVYRGFCGECGSSITWWSQSIPNDIDVMLGTIDDLKEAQLRIDSQWWCKNIIPG